MLLRSTAIGLLCVLALAGASYAGQPVERTVTNAKEKKETRALALSKARTQVSIARKATWRCQRSLGRALYRSQGRERQTRSVRYTRYLVGLWEKRRQSCQRHVDRFLLRDHRSWPRAVATVQRVFPGTEAWLLSCSDAEGYNRSDPTRWVIYGGGLYYPGAEHSHNGSLPQVGGPMQFMWGTFKGMYRHGLEHARSKGFIVPGHLRDPGHVRAWRSMLAQAIAAGWARYTGNDNYHWSASFGNGC